MCAEGVGRRGLIFMDRVSGLSQNAQTCVWIFVNV